MAGVDADGNQGAHSSLGSRGRAGGCCAATTDRAVLVGIARALGRGGRLAMDRDSLTSFLASSCPSGVVAARANGDMLADRYHLDALTGRFEARRTVIRGGRTRRVQF